MDCWDSAGAAVSLTAWDVRKTLKEEDRVE